MTGMESSLDALRPFAATAAALVLLLGVAAATSYARWRARRRVFEEAQRRLANPTGRPKDTPPTEPSPPWRALFKEWLGRKGVVRQLTLEAQREVRVTLATSSQVNTPTGEYHVGAEGPYQLREWLPPGQYVFHVEGNPQALSQAYDPKGFNSRYLQMVNGDVPLRLMGAAYQGRGSSIDWRKLLPILGIVAAVLVAAAYVARKMGWV